ncbi:MAG: lytic murein transglycosylase [Pseudohongiellaceae bacterium]
MTQYVVPGTRPVRDRSESQGVNRWLSGILMLLVFVILSIPAIVRAQDSEEPQVEPIDEEWYERWLASLIDEARERGISDSLIRDVLEPVRPIPRVISNDRSQAEFVETLEEYLERRVTDWRIDTGRQRLAEHAGLLQRITREYGVPGRYIVAIWGIETNYGNFTGGTEVIRALVTLAFDPRRADYFRSQLFAALQILEEGHISHEQMVGSWAGAMGQSQFMPGSFLDHAVDFDGDGRRDIWQSEEDVLASIANYLDQRGWQAGQVWGRPVQLPSGLDLQDERWQQSDYQGSCSVLRRHSVRLPLSEWQEAGVRREDGSDLPEADLRASVIQPDGPDGQAFLVYNNFRTILGYNCANSYALAVSLLADQLVGR